MSSLGKMWVSFASMGFMLISMILIYVSRYKIKNSIVSFIFAAIAYLLLIVGFLTMVYVVFSGPTSGS